MPAGKLVFSGMEFVKSSRGGSSVRISAWRGTNTGGSTSEEGSVIDKQNCVITCKEQVQHLASNACEKYGKLTQ